MSETSKPDTDTKVASMYANLAPYDEDGGDTVLIFSRAKGLVYITVAESMEHGDAGGGLMTTSRAQRLMPGLNPLPKGYWERVKSDVARQVKRSGTSITDQVIKRDLKVIKNIERMDAADVADMLERSANIEYVGSLRGSANHGEAATRIFKNFWDHNAPDEVKTLRHYWAQATGSKKVA